MALHAVVGFSRHLEEHCSPKWLDQQRPTRARELLETTDLGPSLPTWPIIAVLYRLFTHPTASIQRAFSGDAGNCVCVSAPTGKSIRLRESDAPRTVITTTPEAFRSLIRAVSPTGAAASAKHP